MGFQTKLICRSILLALIGGMSAFGGPITLPLSSIFIQDVTGYVDLQNGLPAGFFGSDNGIPSDPIQPRLLGFVGKPAGFGSPFPQPSSIDPVLLFDFATPDVDTALRFALQNADMTYPQPLSTNALLEHGSFTLNNIGDSVDVGFPLIYLGGKSVQPLVVTYNGANPTEFQYSIDFGLLGGFPTATIRRTAEGGGTIDIDPNYPGIEMILTFRHDTSQYSLTKDLDFVDGRGGLRFVPEPGSFALAAAGAIGIALLRFSGCRLPRY